MRRAAAGDQTHDSTFNILTPYQSDHNDHQSPSGVWSTLTVMSLHYDPPKCPSCCVIS